MSSLDLMRDPFYAPLIFKIEKKIHAIDREALVHGIAFTDSQVRSTLIKVRKAASGGSPFIPIASERDQQLAGLYEQLVALRSTLVAKNSVGETRELPTEAYSMALRTIEESIKTRTSGPGSRDYLDFLEGFVQRGC